MGVNDAREQLEVAKAEVARLEQALAHERALRGEYQTEHSELKRERDSLARLHEVATERTVQLAAVIEKAKATRIRRAGQLDQPSPYPILDAADTSSALAEIRAEALEDWARERQRIVNEMDDTPPGAYWEGADHAAQALIGSALSRAASIRQEGGAA